jgi:hypothetical protein
VLHDADPGTLLKGCLMRILLGFSALLLLTPADGALAQSRSTCSEIKALCDASVPTDPNRAATWRENCKTRFATCMQTGNWEGRLNATGVAKK